MARSDITMSTFEGKWRENLSTMLTICQVNLDSFRKLLSTDRQFFYGNPKLAGKKAIALYSTLLSQEADFLQIVYDLLRCHGLESAREAWSGRYQLKFRYDKVFGFCCCLLSLSNNNINTYTSLPLFSCFCLSCHTYIQSTRDRCSPFDVCMGCLRLAHGLEYEGGCIRYVTGYEFENALQKVVSSAFTRRGACFMTHDEERDVNSLDIKVLPCPTLLLSLSYSLFLVGYLWYILCGRCICIRETAHNPCPRATYKVHLALHICILDSLSLSHS